MFFRLRHLASMPRRYSPLSRSSRSLSSSSYSSLSPPTYRHRKGALSRRPPRYRARSESSYDSNFDKDHSRRNLRSTHSRRNYSSTKEYRRSRVRSRSLSPVDQWHRGRVARRSGERYRRQGSQSGGGSTEERSRIHGRIRGLDDNPRYGPLDRYNQRTERTDRRRGTEARTPIFERQGGNDGIRHAATTAREWVDDTPEEGETRWQKRRRIRESLMGRVNVWDVSPEPPRKLAERFDVGADERKKKERKRKRKEERRARREAKRAKVAAEQDELTAVVGTGDVAKPDEQGNGLENISRPVDEDKEEEEEEEVVGPAPPKVEREGGNKGVDYGKALRPGEGSKMAAFVQDGVRIPRRGEIGLTSDEISAFETQGYVMSGSRNRRMEAIRIRKENQIYSAEELAALSQFSHEERKVREERIMNQFRTLVESKVGERGEFDETENIQNSDIEPKERSRRVVD